MTINFLQLALYCWLSVFWSQAHKEERFLFPIYPLIVVAGAISVDTIQKLWYHFFVKVQKKHYLEHTTWISLLLIGLSILLSIMRMVALYKNYHASMDIWMHVNHLSHTDEFHKGILKFSKNFVQLNFMSIWSVKKYNNNMWWKF